MKVVLSHPLSIFALVSRYLANKLILYEPLPRAEIHFLATEHAYLPPRQIAWYYHIR